MKGRSIFNRLRQALEPTYAIAPREVLRVKINHVKDQIALSRRETVRLEQELAFLQDQMLHADDSTREGNSGRHSQLGG